MVYAAYNGLNLQQQVGDPDIALPGQAILDQLTVSYLNSGAETAQEVLLDVGTAAASTVYTFNIDGQAIEIQYVVADGDPWNNVAPGTAITAPIIQARLVSGLERYQTGFSVAATGAAQITLTRTVLGVSTPVTVAGGGAGFAVNANTAANASSHIPYGRVVVAAGSDTDGRYGALPTATGQAILGFNRRVHSQPRISYAEATANNIPVDGVRPRDTGAAQKQGAQWVQAEAAFVGTEANVFFRHTANGALTATGVVAPAAGTGLDQAPVSVTVDGPSQVIEGGLIVVPLLFNLP